MGLDELVAARGSALLRSAYLNALPPGLGSRTTTGRGQAIVVTFGYRAGPDVVVFVHVDGKRDVGAANGAVTGQLTPRPRDAVMPYAGWICSYQDRYTDRGPQAVL